MTELILEPYASIQQWRCPEAIGRWEEWLAAYLQDLAWGCAQAPQAMIGHIKALALFPQGQYLRVSVVAPNRPATIEGSTPPGCSSLELTLNVLVYGLRRAQIDSVVESVTQALALKWGIDISEQALPASPHLH